MSEDQKQTATDIAQCLKHSACIWARFIKLALDTFPNANKTTIGKTKEWTHQLIRYEAWNLVGERLANVLANWMELEYIEEFKTNAKQKQARATRNPTIINAFLKEVRLGPTVNRAKQHDSSVTMDDIKKWQRENFELRPWKFNS